MYKVLDSLLTVMLAIASDKAWQRLLSIEQAQQPMLGCKVPQKAKPFKS
jgi:hypothetical protein